MFPVLFHYDPYSHDKILDLSKDRRLVFSLLPENRGEAVVRSPTTGWLNVNTKMTPDENWISSVLNSGLQGRKKSDNQKTEGWSKM